MQKGKVWEEEPSCGQESSATELASCSELRIKSVKGQLLLMCSGEGFKAVPTARNLTISKSV